MSERLVVKVTIAPEIKKRLAGIRDRLESAFEAALQRTAEEVRAEVNIRLAETMGAIARRRAHALLKQPPEAEKQP